MMSASLPQYNVAFNHLASPTIIGHEQAFQPQHDEQSGLEGLRHPTQYNLQFQPHVQGLIHRKDVLKQHRVHPYATGPMTPMVRGPRDGMTQDRSGRGGSSSGPVRRRISRACDQCNQLRTKCDGKSPCAHCIEFNLTCEYIRERKKRGKASRKDIQQQQQQQQQRHSVASVNGESSSDSPQTNSGMSEDQKVAEIPKSHPPHTKSAAEPSSPHMRRISSNDVLPFENLGHTQLNRSGHSIQVDLQSNQSDHNGIHDQDTQIMVMEGYNDMDEFHRNLIQSSAPEDAQGILQSNPNMVQHSMMQGNGMQVYAESPYATMLSPSHQQMSHGFRLPNGESPMSGFMSASPPVGASPGWLGIQSSPGTINGQRVPQTLAQILRYPVLQPLLPHLASIMPVSIACDLLELYFQSSSTTYTQPVSPYVLGYNFRKHSILRQNNPRKCSPALLASMLWIGAQTSESSYLISPPSSRGKVCQRLLELTIGLLKPLIHSSARGGEGHATFAGTPTVTNMALGGFGVGMPFSIPEGEGGSPGAVGELDDIATYMHLAVVASASEYKAASLRWWNAAWSLARELKLYKELPQSEPQIHQEQDDDAPGEVDADSGITGTNEYVQNGERRQAVKSHDQSGTVTEEEREERRRVWWLLYIMDRHLALCYNRPLSLLDVECEELLQPVKESFWQAGEFYRGNSSHVASDPNSPLFRRRGPGFECTGQGIFGYFLPLMTILGEIVDLNHARNHPRFGLRFRDSSEWDDQATEISRQLDTYGQSLRDFEARNSTSLAESGVEVPGGLDSHHDVGTPSVHSVASSTSKIAETLLQTKVVVAYGTHVMHTLHILLNGKWDPISLLDDNDLWISSQSFITATKHAVSAAEAISKILEHDPDLSFMPFFFGIYLLQGSFLLLLIADKLQGEASHSVVRACETIVRAHEACVVTLNTEYQRNFRKVMRSALAQVKGLGDSVEQQLRRREVLSLYRWTGDGTGLAL